MYTITRGPSRLATQRRTGPSQQVEAKSGCELKQKPGPWPAGSRPVPKLVFSRVNGKRVQSLGGREPREEEVPTQAHEENVRFVYEAWQQVEEELGASEGPDSRHGTVQYVENTPNPSLKGFVPIDLEEWWAKQFLANIENSS
ncbi:MAPK regulated corepressor interacting protein 2 [Callorhinchus milii]|uniref:Protein FAM195A n=1 Tax=Callorhinchus milii TaxID=7868 RepID=K4G6M9_CALMI|nr:MAPK regulated corepressor interacting protein 2 [Callorhinchus milii]AFM87561.1 hypothetical protein [Callorhinchus milii]